MKGLQTPEDYRNKAEKRLGQKFNKLTVSKFLYKKNSRCYYEYTCDCGGTRIAMHNSVQSGRIKECDDCRANTKHQSMNVKHGLSGHPIYTTWQCMNRRIIDPDKAKWYGHVEIEWNTFEKFSEDMLPTWFEGAVIDRIDSKGNYCKENCQWLTAVEHGVKTREDNA